MKKFFSGLYSILLGLVVSVALLNALWGALLLFYLNPPGGPRPKWENYLWIPVGEWIALGVALVIFLLWAFGRWIRDL